jgi:hypothetical protein
LKKSGTKLLQKKRIFIFLSDCWEPVAACDVVMSRQTKIMTAPYRGRLQSCEPHRALGPSLCFCSARRQRSKAQTCYNFISTLGMTLLTKQNIQAGPKDCELHFTAHFSKVLSDFWPIIYSQVAKK